MVAIGIGYVGMLVALLEVMICVEGKRDLSKLPPNTATGMTMAEAKKHPKKLAPKGTHRSAFNPPPAFDARAQWSQCKSISTIRNQGKCGDCWAVAAAAVLSDRICIATGRKDYISAMQAAGCSYPTQNGMQNCNAGGNTPFAFRQAVLYGLSTGGEYNSKTGCVPYDITDEVAKPITCSATCTNKNWSKKLTDDSSANMIDSYWVDYKWDMNDQAGIDASIKHMKEDMFYNGPITASIRVYNDFQMWTADKGPYAPGPAAQLNGFHAIRLIGWNKTREGVSYWVISNSWGEEWGEKGLYYVQMGSNVIGIESNTAAPIVKLDTKCVTSTFCTSPIDQAVRMDFKDHKSPIFLFQGDCALQVEIKGGKVAAVGQAEPIGKKIVNAPKGPIITNRLNTNTEGLSLINAAGDAGGSCKLADKSTKYVCESGPWKIGAEAFTTTQTGKYYKYDGNGQTLWGGAATKQSESSSDSKLDGLFEKSSMATVSSFLDIDGTKMFVWGKDASGKQLTGVMAYPTDSENAKWVTKPGAPNALQAC